MALNDGNIVPRKVTCMDEKKIFQGRFGVKVKKNESISNHFNYDFSYYFISDKHYLVPSYNPSFLIKDINISLKTLPTEITNLLAINLIEYIFASFVFQSSSTSNLLHNILSEVEYCITDTLVILPLQKVNDILRCYSDCTASRITSIISFTGLVPYISHIINQVSAELMLIYSKNQEIYQINQVEEQDIEPLVPVIGEILDISADVDHLSQESNNNYESIIQISNQICENSTDESDDQPNASELTQLIGSRFRESNSDIQTCDFSGFSFKDGLTCINDDQWSINDDKFGDLRNSVKIVGAGEGWYGKRCLLLQKCLKLKSIVPNELARVTRLAAVLDALPKCSEEAELNERSREAFLLYNQMRSTCGPGIVVSRQIRKIVDMTISHQILRSREWLAYALGPQYDFEVAANEDQKVGSRSSRSYEVMRILEKYAQTENCNKTLTSALLDIDAWCRATNMLDIVHDSSLAAGRPTNGQKMAFAGRVALINMLLSWTKEGFCWLVPRATTVRDIIWHHPFGLSLTECRSITREIARRRGWLKEEVFSVQREMVYQKSQAIVHSPRVLPSPTSRINKRRGLSPKSLAFADESCSNYASVNANKLKNSIESGINFKQVSDDVSNIILQRAQEKHLLTRDHQEWDHANDEVTPVDATEEIEVPEQFSVNISNVWLATVLECPEILEPRDVVTSHFTEMFGIYSEVMFEYIYLDPEYSSCNSKSATDINLSNSKSATDINLSNIDSMEDIQGKHAKLTGHAPTFQTFLADINAFMNSDLVVIPTSQSSTRDRRERDFPCLPLSGWWPDLREPAVWAAFLLYAYLRRKMENFIGIRGNNTHIAYETCSRIGLQDLTWIILRERGISTVPGGDISERSESNIHKALCHAVACSIENTLNPKHTLSSAPSPYLSVFTNQKSDMNLSEPWIILDMLMAHLLIVAPGTNWAASVGWMSHIKPQPISNYGEIYISEPSPEKSSSHNHELLTKFCSYLNALWGHEALQAAGLQIREFDSSVELHHDARVADLAIQNAVVDGKMGNFVSNGVISDGCIEAQKRLYLYEKEALPKAFNNITDNPENETTCKSSGTDTDWSRSSSANRCRSTTVASHPFDAVQNNSTLGGVKEYKLHPRITMQSLLINIPFPSAYQLLPSSDLYLDLCRRFPTEEDITKVFRVPSAQRSSTALAVRWYLDNLNGILAIASLPRRTFPVRLLPFLRNLRFPILGGYRRYDSSHRVHYDSLMSTLRFSADTFTSVSDGTTPLGNQLAAGFACERADFTRSLRAARTAAGLLHSAIFSLYPKPSIDFSFWKNWEARVIESRGVYAMISRTAASFLGFGYGPSGESHIFSSSASICSSAENNTQYNGLVWTNKPKKELLGSTLSGVDFASIMRDIRRRWPEDYNQVLRVASAEALLRVKPKWSNIGNNLPTSIQGSLLPWAVRGDIDSAVAEAEAEEEVRAAVSLSLVSNELTGQDLRRLSNTSRMSNVNNNIQFFASDSPKKDDSLIYRAKYCNRKSTPFVKYNKKSCSKTDNSYTQKLVKSINSCNKKVDFRPIFPNKSSIYRGIRNNQNQYKELILKDLSNERQVSLTKSNSNIIKRYSFSIPSKTSTINRQKNYLPKDIIKTTKNSKSIIISNNVKSLSTKRTRLSDSRILDINDISQITKKIKYPIKHARLLMPKTSSKRTLLNISDNESDIICYEKRLIKNKTISSKNPIYINNSTLNDLIKGSLDEKSSYKRLKSNIFKESISLYSKENAFELIERYSQKIYKTIDNLTRFKTNYFSNLFVKEKNMSYKAKTQSFRVITNPIRMKKELLYYIKISKLLEVIICNNKIKKDQHSNTKILKKSSRYYLISEINKYNHCLNNISHSNKINNKENIYKLKLPLDRLYFADELENPRYSEKSFDNFDLSLKNINVPYSQNSNQQVNLLDHFSDDLTDTMLLKTFTNSTLKSPSNHSTVENLESQLDTTINLDKIPENSKLNHRNVKLLDNEPAEGLEALVERAIRESLLESFESFPVDTLRPGEGEYYSNGNAASPQKMQNKQSAWSANAEIFDINSAITVREALPGWKLLREVLVSHALSSPWPEPEKLYRHQLRNAYLLLKVVAQYVKEHPPYVSVQAGRRMEYYDQVLVQEDSNMCRMMFAPKHRFHRINNWPGKASLAENQYYKSEPGVPGWGAAARASSLVETPEQAIERERHNIDDKTTDMADLANVLQRRNVHLDFNCGEYKSECDLLANAIETDKNVFNLKWQSGSARPINHQQTANNCFLLSEPENKVAVGLAAGGCPPLPPSDVNCVPQNLWKHTNEEFEDYCDELYVSSCATGQPGCLGYLNGQRPAEHFSRSDLSEIPPNSILPTPWDFRLAQIYSPDLNGNLSDESTRTMAILRSTLGASSMGFAGTFMPSEYHPHAPRTWSPRPKIKVIDEPQVNRSSPNLPCRSVSSCLETVEGVEYVDREIEDDHISSLISLKTSYSLEKASNESEQQNVGQFADSSPKSKELSIYDELAAQSPRSGQLSPLTVPSSPIANSGLNNTFDIHYNAKISRENNRIENSPLLTELQRQLSGNCKGTFTSLPTKNQLSKNDDEWSVQTNSPCKIQNKNLFNTSIKSNEESDHHLDKVINNHDKNRSEKNIEYGNILVKKKSNNWLFTCVVPESPVKDLGECSGTAVLALLCPLLEPEVQKLCFRRVHKAQCMTQPPEDSRRLYWLPSGLLPPVDTLEKKFSRSLTPGQIRLHFMESSFDHRVGLPPTLTYQLFPHTTYTELEARSLGRKRKVSHAQRVLVDCDFVLIRFVSILARTDRWECTVCKHWQWLECEEPPAPSSSICPACRSKCVKLDPLASLSPEMKHERLKFAPPADSDCEEWYAAEIICSLTFPSEITNFKSDDVNCFSYRYDGLHISGVLSGNCILLSHQLPFAILPSRYVPIIPFIRARSTTFANLYNSSPMGNQSDLSHPDAFSIFKTFTTLNNNETTDDTGSYSDDISNSRNIDEFFYDQSPASYTENSSSTDLQILSQDLAQQKSHDESTDSESILIGESNENTISTYNEMETLPVINEELFINDDPETNITENICNSETDISEKILEEPCNINKSLINERNLEISKVEQYSENEEQAISKVLSNGIVNCSEELDIVKSKVLNKNINNEILPQDKDTIRNSNILLKRLSSVVLRGRKDEPDDGSALKRLQKKIEMVRMRPTKKNLLNTSMTAISTQSQVNTDTSNIESDNISVATEVSVDMSDSSNTDSTDTWDILSQSSGTNFFAGEGPQWSDNQSQLLLTKTNRYHQEAGYQNKSKYMSTNKRTKDRTINRNEDIENNIYNKNLNDLIDSKNYTSEVVEQKDTQNNIVSSLRKRRGHTPVDKRFCKPNDTILDNNIQSELHSSDKIYNADKNRNIQNVCKSDFVTSKSTNIKALSTNKFTSLSSIDKNLPLSDSTLKDSTLLSLDKSDDTCKIDNLKDHKNKVNDEVFDTNENNSTYLHNKVNEIYNSESGKQSKENSLVNQSVLTNLKDVSYTHDNQNSNSSEIVVSRNNDEMPYCKTNIMSPPIEHANFSALEQKNFEELFLEAQRSASLMFSSPIKINTKHKENHNSKTISTFNDVKQNTFNSCSLYNESLQHYPESCISKWNQTTSSENCFTKRPQCYSSETKRSREILSIESKSCDYIDDNMLQVECLIPTIRVNNKDNTYSDEIKDLDDNHYDNVSNSFYRESWKRNIITELSQELPDRCSPEIKQLLPDSYTPKIRGGVSNIINIKQSIPSRTRSSSFQKALGGMEMGGYTSALKPQASQCTSLPSEMAVPPSALSPDDRKAPVILKRSQKTMPRFNKADIDLSKLCSDEDLSQMGWSINSLEMWEMFIEPIESEAFHEFELVDHIDFSEEGQRRRTHLVNVVLPQFNERLEVDSSIKLRFPDVSQIL